MKPIILKQHEVIHLRDHQSVIAWRVVKSKKPVSIGDKWWTAGDVIEANSECPYGLTGEERWVKETFQPLFLDGVRYEDTDWGTGKGYSVRYVATDGATDWVDPDDNTTNRRMPSTHMPRWASRFTVTLDVGVKRIQEVTEEEGYGSGYKRAASFYAELDRRGSCAQLARMTGRPPTSPASAFVRDLANESNPGSWDRNDYFWKITCTLKKP